MRSINLLLMVVLFYWFETVIEIPVIIDSISFSKYQIEFALQSRFVWFAHTGSKCSCTVWPFWHCSLSALWLLLLQPLLLLTVFRPRPVRASAAMEITARHTCPWRTHKLPRIFSIFLGPSCACNAMRSCDKLHGIVFIIVFIMCTGPRTILTNFRRTFYPNWLKL